MNGLSNSTQLWLAARGLLLERSADLCEQLARAAKSFDPEAIHDLRVSSRRLREGFALFAPSYPKKQLTSLLRELKKLTGMMGAIRNTDEALLFFTELAPDLSHSESDSVSRLLATLRTEREQESVALKHYLRKLDAATLRRQLLEKCGQPLIFTKKSDDLLQPVGEFLLQAIAAREKPLGDIINQAIIEANVTAQHRLRIAVKKFRYRCEFLAPLATHGYPELYGAIKEYQDLLGKMHDLDTFAGLADEMIADRSITGAVQQLIAQRRRRLFSRFMKMQQTLPLTSLGDRARTLL